MRACFAVTVVCHRQCMDVLQFGTFQALLEIDGFKYETASASAAKWSKSHANTSFLSEVITAPTQRECSIVKMAV